MVRKKVFVALLLGTTLFLNIPPIVFSRSRDSHSVELSDSVEILAAHLSHGIGESPLDSALVKDKMNAAILIYARDGVKYAAKRKAI